MKKYIYPLVAIILIGILVAFLMIKFNTQEPLPCPVYEECIIEAPECESCEPCPEYIPAEPGVIIKEVPVIKEIIKEVIVEVPVEKIVEKIIIINQEKDEDAVLEEKIIKLEEKIEKLEKICKDYEDFKEEISFMHDINSLQDINKAMVGLDSMSATYYVEMYNKYRNDGEECAEAEIELTGLEKQLELIK